ncbi:MAG: BolA family transcriptional regulator [Legionella sp.]|nr:MAG: BolA family transcriptional regulator [Legionella sp.]PJD98826.1 MAG: BolA family transcriptional regulator [Legionella sp.]
MSRQERISKFLQQHFSPSVLEVTDESHFHHVPKGAETHIKIVMVCSSFTNRTRIERHRSINQLLQEELAQGLHALSMHLYSPQEWQEKNHLPLKSPACKDGYDH